jgi:hypothetical protein
MGGGWSGGERSEFLIANVDAATLKIAESGVYGRHEKRVHKDSSAHHA